MLKIKEAAEELNVSISWLEVDDRSIDFLGYRFYHGYTLLRKSTAVRFKRRMRKVKKYHELMDPISAISTVMSYYGWLKHANCLNLTRMYIDYDIRNIIRIICFQNKIHNPLPSRMI